MRYETVRAVVFGVGGGIAVEVLHANGLSHIEPRRYERVDVRVVAEDRASTGEDMWRFVTSSEGK